MARGDPDRCLGRSFRIKLVGRGDGESGFPAGEVIVRKLAQA